MIALIDEGIADIVQNKKVIIYTPNNKGQLPYSFNKSIIPSSIPVNLNWYIGYADSIMADFNMFEITDEIAVGLQFFNSVNGANKRYDKYFRPNADFEKLEIILTDLELAQQLASKQFLLLRELELIFSTKIEDISRTYGAESTTWSLQLEEANSIATAGTLVPEDYVILNSISTARNLTLLEVAEKVIANSDEYKANIGTTLAEKYTFKDRINSCTSNSALINITEELNLL